MDFAKKFMKKYGWKEGDGLGKDKSGINKPLKASLKFDTSGLGVDKAADFNNFWWQRVYNEASSNINITKDAGEISIKVKKDDSVEITTKNYSIKNLKNKNESRYGNFFKSSTLTNTGIEIEDPNKVNGQDMELPKFNNLTDEELFTACGGRTAHKGARHGLKLSGKLQRLQDQEQALLEKYSTLSDFTKSTTVSNEWIEVTNKRKRNKKDKNGCDKMNEENDKMIEDDNVNSLDKLLHVTDYIHKSKKKKKKEKKVDEEISNSFEFVQINQNLKTEDQIKNEIVKLSESSKTIRKKKKKKKNIKNVFGQENMDQTDEMEDDIKIRHDLEENVIKENNSTKFDSDLVQLDSKKSVKEKKLKKNKIGKIKCEDKILAKKIKKTINVLENLNTFLNVN